MSNPKDQHFVAQFHLRNWCGEDNLLQRYKYTPRNIFESERKGPRGVCKELHLYSLEIPDPKLRYAVELKFREIETQAAPIAAKLINGIIPLTSEERSIWVRYLLAQRVRLPGELKKLSERSQKIVENNLGYLTAIAEKQYPGVIHDIPLLAMMDYITGNENGHNVLLNMKWDVLDLSSAKHRLLTSDQPIIYNSGLKDPNAEVLLPLSPTKLFTAQGKFTSLKSTREIVYTINDTIACFAKNVVIANDDTQNLFIKRRFKNGIVVT